MIAKASFRSDLSVPTQLEITRRTERLTLSYMPAREIVVLQIQATDVSRRMSEVRISQGWLPRSHVASLDARTVDPNQSYAWSPRHSVKPS